MTCARNCQHGYLGTDEIRDYSSNDQDDAPVSEGRIIQHLEFTSRTGQKTQVRLCPCQGTETHSGAVRKWRDE